MTTTNHTNPSDDSFERGRRRGVVETLATLADFLKIGTWREVAALKDVAQAAEYEPGEFDLAAFLEAMVLEQQEAVVAEADGELFGADNSD
jgi:hypothetical protein